MNIQTFVLPEMEDVTVDNSTAQQWSERVEALGLIGQKTLTEKRPIPFMAMNERMAQALQTLCPRQLEMNQYGFEAIPNEVLSILEMAVKENHFKKIEIWYDDKNPDPVAVGFIGKWRSVDSKWKTIGHYETEDEAKASENCYNVQFQESGKFLIARWGAEAKALSQLILDAKSRWLTEKTVALTKLLRQTERELQDLDLNAAEMFG